MGAPLVDTGGAFVFSAFLSWFSGDFVDDVVTGESVDAGKFLEFELVEVVELSELVDLRSPAAAWEFEFHVEHRFEILLA
jgi:hypothetical protein